MSSMPEEKSQEHRMVEIASVFVQASSDWHSEFNMKLLTSNVPFKKKISRLGNVEH